MSCQWTDNGNSPGFDPLPLTYLEIMFGLHDLALALACFTVSTAFLKKVLKNIKGKNQSSHNRFKLKRAHFL